MKMVYRLTTLSAYVEHQAPTSGTHGPAELRGNQHQVAGKVRFFIREVHQARHVPAGDDQEVNRRSRLDVGESHCPVVLIGALAGKSAGNDPAEQAAIRNSPHLHRQQSSFISQCPSRWKHREFYVR